MKVTREEENFKPVTIVLETREEVAIMVELLGNTYGTGVAINFTTQLYHALKNLGIVADNSDECDKYSTGTIRAL